MHRVVSWRASRNQPTWMFRGTVRPHAWHPSPGRINNLTCVGPHATTLSGHVKDWVDRYGNEPRKGSDILVQALEREGVDQLFAYPGGASMEIHQALTRSDRIKNYLCRHEQVNGGSCSRSVDEFQRGGGRIVEG